MSMFSSHNKTKLTIHYIKIAGKVSNIWKFKNSLLNNTQIKEKTTGMLENILNIITIKIQYNKFCGGIAKIETFIALNAYIRKEKIFKH